MSPLLRTVALTAVCAPAMTLAAAETATAPATPAPSLRLLDLSLTIQTAAGGSTVDDHALEHLQIGGHDPNRRGFTFQEAELALSGAVDPYFTADAYLVVTEAGLELEEAFGRTTALPHGLEAKAGYFLTEFGRNNPTHPHAWPWLDRPLVAARLLGPDGARGAGARLAWQAPTPWVSRLIIGAQNADDETMVSFRGTGHLHDDEPADPVTTIGGRTAMDEAHVSRLDDMLWLVRWENAWDIDRVLMKAGASFLNGPNASGDHQATRIWGVDAALKWVPAGARQGFPFVTVEAEYLRRDAEAGDDSTTGIPGDDLVDQGFYVQTLWGFHQGWAVGLRGERVWGRGDSIDQDAAAAIDAEADADRSTRTRLSPLISWNPSHFSRLRLQYNYDRYSHDPDESIAHSIWLGLELLIGAHPSHAF